MLLWVCFWNPVAYIMNCRNMLHGPWKEASAPVLTLHVDDKNVNGEAIAMALAYLYGHHPKLNDNNAFRVLAAASFLDLQVLQCLCYWFFCLFAIFCFSFYGFDLVLQFLFFVQDLCAICTDFIIAELWTSNFLAYQVLRMWRCFVKFLLYSKFRT